LVLLLLLLFLMMLVMSVQRISLNSCQTWNCPSDLKRVPKKGNVSKISYILIFTERQIYKCVIITTGALGKDLERFTERLKTKAETAVMITITCIECREKSALPQEGIEWIENGVFAFTLVAQTILIDGKYIEGPVAWLVTILGPIEISIELRSLTLIRSVCGWHEGTV